jgi:hypothetical protein
LALLLDRLEYDAGDGAFCLGLYGDPAARPALEKMLSEIPTEAAEPAEDEAASNVGLRREIQHALEALDAPPTHYEAEPFDLVAQYPERALPEFDVLTELERLDLLASPEADIRAGSAESLFNSEVSPAARRALLDLAKSDPSAEVRGNAWAAVADATDDDAVRDAMLAVLRDTSKPLEERGGAAVGLYAVADRDDVQEALEALYVEGESPEKSLARAKALEAMWRSLWKPYAKYFPGNLDHSDPAVVRQALRGAGYFQLTREAEKIASYFDREGKFETVRDDALFAYALAMPGQTTRGRIRGLFRKIDALADLSRNEAEMVEFALDERLKLHGFAPVFAGEGEDEHDHEHGHEHGHVHETAPAPAAPVPAPKPGRNDPCPCGSGKKFKKCHGQ